MKRWLSSALILLLVLMMAMPALAEDEVQYATTKDFIRVLEENDLKYTYDGIDSDNDERVFVSFDPDPYEECKFRFFFNEDQDLVSIRMFYLVTVTAGETFTLKTVNDLNYDYKHVKFVFDDSDSTISLKMDVPLYGDCTGEAVYKTFSRAIQILTQDEVQTALLSLK